MKYVSNAFVLKSISSDEQDRYLTLLTDSGVINAYARKASRNRGSMSGATEQLAYSSFTLFKNREKIYVDNADAISIFFELRNDLPSLSLACYLSQLCAELAPKDEDCTQYLRLILNSLSFLNDKKRTPDFIKPLFELRILTLSGYMPDLIGCRECGCFESDKMYFSTLNGTLICSSCRKAASSYDVIVSKACLAAMRHIIYSDILRLFNYTIPEDDSKKLNLVSEAYLINILGKSYPSLDYYKSIINYIPEDVNGKLF